MSFDAIAPWYERLERITFGDDLQRCRVACLGEIDPPCQVLIAGEGNGRFLCELLRRYPKVEVDCRDASPRMLQLARRRLEDELPDRLPSVRFLPGDIESLSESVGHYDLLVTHFFLDCFSEPALTRVIRKLARAATDNAVWLLSDFCLPRQGMMRFRTSAWLKAMYFFFRATTGIEAKELIDPTPHLCREGFSVSRQHLFRQGLLKAEMWRRTGRRVRQG